MNQRASLFPAMRIASIIVGTVGALGLGALLLNLSGVGPGSASATAHIAQPAPTPASGAAKVKAMQTLMALPELKAWSARLEETSGGQVRGALIEYDSAPKEVAGQRYWQFSFVENGDDAAHPWDSFLVAVHGDQILVEDQVNDTQLTLAQWRRDKHPMTRNGADANG